MLIAESAKLDEGIFERGMFMHTGLTKLMQLQHQNFPGIKVACTCSTHLLNGSLKVAVKVATYVALAEKWAWPVQHFRRALINFAPPFLNPPLRFFQRRTHINPFFVCGAKHRFNLGSQDRC